MTPIALITDYPGETRTDSAGLKTIKIHPNSVLSTMKSKLTGMYISNMYLDTPLDRFEYMHIPYSNFPPDIIEHYNLASKVAADGFIYIEIRRAMYGLKQAGKLANQQLEKVLATGGYLSPQNSPHLLHPCCEQLWCQVRQQARRLAPREANQHQLPDEI